MDAPQAMASIIAEDMMRLKQDEERLRSLQKTVEGTIVQMHNKLGLAFENSEMRAEDLHRNFAELITFCVARNGAKAELTSVLQVIAKHSRQTAPVAISWLQELNLIRRALSGNEEQDLLQDTHFIAAVQQASAHKNWFAAHEFLTLLSPTGRKLPEVDDVFVAMAADFPNSREVLAKWLPSLGERDDYNALFKRLLFVKRSAETKVVEFLVDYSPQKPEPNTLQLKNVGPATELNTINVSQFSRAGDTSKIPDENKSAFQLACEKGEPHILATLIARGQGAITIPYTVMYGRLNEVCSYSFHPIQCGVLAFSPLDVAAFHLQWHCIPILLQYASNEDKTGAQLKKIQKKYPAAFELFPNVDEVSKPRALFCVVRKAAIEHFYKTRSKFLGPPDGEQIQQLLQTLTGQLQATLETLAGTIKAALLKGQSRITEDSFLLLLMYALKQFPDFFKAINVKIPDPNYTLKPKQQMEYFCQQISRIAVELVETNQQDQKSDDWVVVKNP